MRVRVVYQKGDLVRFLSHLDVMRVLVMAMARAKWPVQMSLGFSPKPKVSFYAPLPVGTSGREEYFDAILSRAVNVSCLARSLSGSLPKGFGVSQVFLVPDGQESLEEKIVASVYALDLKGVERQAMSRAVDAFLKEERVLFQVRRPKDTRTVDLRGYVRDFCVEAEKGLRDDHLGLVMTVTHDKGRTIRPQWVLSALSRFGLNLDPLEAIIDRRKILFD
ncbi:MAG: TIGR03936 family radical SAM-associated protein [Bacillota bacterium]